MALPPRLPGPSNRPEREIVDVDWTEVRAEPQSPASREIGTRSCLKTAGLLAAGAMLAIIGLFILLYLAGGVDDGSSAGSDVDSQAETATGELPPAVAGMSDEVRETMLCGTDETTQLFQDTSRQWLQATLEVMANDGVLELPMIENPIERMVAHSNIDWVGGPPTFVDARTTADGTYVTCGAGIVFRDVIMLPDESWSDAEISIPEMQFELFAAKDSEVMRLSFNAGEPDEVMHKVNISVAGATMSLANFYDMLGSEPGPVMSGQQRQM